MMTRIIDMAYVMDLKQLRHFLAAAETESFSGGAERSFVTQPALSASIAKLEADLETRLFVRSKRGVTLTSEGRRLAETARFVIAECSKVRQDLKRSKTRETVRIGVINTLSMSLVARMVEGLRIEHPNVGVEILDAAPEELQRLVADSKVDVFLKSVTDQRAAHAVRRGEIVLFAEPFVLLTPLDHAFRNRKSVVLADLDGEAFVARMNCESRLPLTELFKASGVRPRVVCRTHQDERAITLVERGFGVAIVPRHVGSERTHKIDFAGRPHSRMIVLGRTGIKRRDAVDRVVDFAKAARWP
jgi:DNA-binding transcriptional LysR family regulator